MNGDGLRLPADVCTFRLRGARVSGQVAQRRSAEAVCARRTVSPGRDVGGTRGVVSASEQPP